jgi:hypothetical protein
MRLNGCRQSMYNRRLAYPKDSIEVDSLLQANGKKEMRRKRWIVLLQAYDSLNCSACDSN